MSQLSDLIQAGRSAGKTDDSIWKELSSRGWIDADIIRALNGAAVVSKNATPPMRSATEVSRNWRNSLLSTVGICLLVVGCYYLITLLSSTIILK